MDPNALIGDKLKAMSEALAAGEPLPEIDQDDLGRVPIVLVIIDDNNNNPARARTARWER